MQLETLIFDTHMHLYRNYDLSILFESAYQNINSVAQKNNVTGNFIAVLGLALTDREYSWDELRSHTELIKGKGGDWEIIDLPDRCLIKAVSNQQQVLYFLPGSQVVTSENLELLVLGVKEPVRNSMESMLWHIDKNAGSLLIAPWGVGKWLGARGGIVSQLISECQADFFLGDNSGRPWLWQNIRQFKLAKIHDIQVFPGTDPLPISGQEKKAGTNVVMFNMPFAENFSAETIVSSLKKKDVGITTSQTTESIWAFFKNQIAMRL